jgi:hypothetical protein
LPLSLLLLSLLGGCRHPAPTSALPSGPVHFTDVARSAGLTYRNSPGGTSPLNILKITSGAGTAFLDYDGDGWMDILCVSYPRPALFRNREGHGFLDVTGASGLRLPDGRWNGCATGDFDNDGQVDLFLTGYNRVALLRNRGNGTFADVTAASGIRVTKWATSAAFADVDRDGLLDLYVGCYVNFGPGMPEFMNVRGVRLAEGPPAYRPQKGVLFHNLGGGKFRDATQEAGLDKADGKTLGVAFADPEDRGCDDLYLANDEEPQDYFRNDGHGHFRNVALENGTAFNGEGGRQGGMGLDFGDYDGDGRPDLFVGTFADEQKSLYRNAGGGQFEQDSTRAGIGESSRPRVTFGAKFLDVDNDGRLDLLFINGHVRDQVQRVDPNNSYPQRSQLFWNQGGGRFREVSDQVGEDFRRPIVGRGLAVGDFDNDGQVDALEGDLEGAPVLLHNDGARVRGNWLSLRLVGTKSNRMAIGARIELVAGGGRQVRELRTDGSYLSAHDPRVHFGLGAATKIDEIRIRWPSGARQRLRDVAPNQFLRVTEASSG